MDTYKGGQNHKESKICHDTNQSETAQVIKSSVLVCVPVAVTNPINEEHHKRRKGSFARCFQLTVQLQGMSEQEAEAEIMEEPCLLAFSQDHAQPAQTRPTCLEMLLPTVGWDLPQRLSIKAISHRHGPSDTGHSSAGVPR